MNTEIIIILAKLKKMKQEYSNNKELTDKEIETINSELVRIEGLIATGGISVEEINNMIKVQIDELQKVVNEDLIALKEELEIEIEDNTDNISNMVDVVIKLNDNINRIDLELTALRKEHDKYTEDIVKLQEDVKKILIDLENLKEGLIKIEMEFKAYKETTAESISSLEKAVEDLKNNGLDEDAVRKLILEYLVTVEENINQLENKINEIKKEHPTFVDLQNVQTNFDKEIKRLEDMIGDGGNNGNSADEDDIDLTVYAKLNFVEEDNTTPVDYYMPANIYVLREKEPVSTDFYNVIADEETYYDTYFTPKMSVLFEGNVDEYMQNILGYNDDKLLDIDYRVQTSINSSSGSTERYKYSNTINNTILNSVNSIETMEFIEHNKFPIITFKMDYNEYLTGLFRILYKNKFNKIYDYRKKELELYGLNIKTTKQLNKNINVQIQFLDKEDYKFLDTYQFFNTHENKRKLNKITGFSVRKEIINTNPLISLRNTPKANQEKLDIDVTQLIKPPTLDKVYHTNVDFNVGNVYYTRAKFILNENSFLDSLNTHNFKIDIIIDKNNIENDINSYLDRIESDASYGWGLNSYNATKENPFKMKPSNIAMKGDINPNIILLGHTDNMYIEEFYQQMLDILNESSSSITLEKKVEDNFENSLFIRKSIDGLRVTDEYTTEIGIIPQIKLSTPFKDYYNERTEIAHPVQYIFSVMNYKNSPSNKLGYAKYLRETTSFDKIVIDKNLLYKNSTEDLGITGELKNSSYEGKGKKVNIHKSITPKDRNDLLKVDSNIYEHLMNTRKYDETTVVNIFNDLSNITDSFSSISYGINSNNKSKLPTLNILNGKFSVVNDLGHNLINVINDKVLMQLTKEGNLRIGGQLESNYADYSEMFELQSPIGVNEKLAKIVKLNNNGKVELASKGDKPLGIISVNASVVGNNPNQWNNKFVLDKYERLIEKYTLSKSPYVYFDNEEEPTIFVNSIKEIMSEIENEVIENEITVYKENETTGEMEQSIEKRLIKNKATIKTVLPKLNIIEGTVELEKLEKAITETDFNRIQSIRKLHLLLDDMQLLEEKKLAVAIAMYAENKLKIQEVEDNESESEVIENDNISIEHGYVYNIDYDFDQEYEMREHRDEWAKVGIMGQLMLHVEEKVNVGDYITTGNNGYGIKSTEPTNIKVMEVIDEDLVKVYFK